MTKSSRRQTHSPSQPRRQTRLKDFPYRGYYRYFITVRCYQQAASFAGGNFVAEAVATLKKAADKEGFRVWVYCFMPDHLHLLVEGDSEDADLKGFMSLFKQQTAFGFRQRCAARLWQPGYYERVLRRDESTARVAAYILQNPTRRGLAADYASYPYSGSLEVNDIRQLLT